MTSITQLIQRFPNDSQAKFCDSTRFKIRAENGDFVRRVFTLRKVSLHPNALSQSFPEKGDDDAPFSARLPWSSQTKMLTICSRTQLSAKSMCWFRDRRML